MAVIDPKKHATQKSFENKSGSSANVEKKRITAGKKFMVPVGAAYKMKNDKRILEMALVCVEDYNDTKEEGAIHFENFYLTERALFRISNWALAMGWESAFDPDKLESIQDIMLHGGFVGIFDNREYNGKSYLDLKWFNIADDKTRAKNGSIEFNDEEMEIIKQAEQAYPKIIKYKKENFGDEYLSVGLANDSDEQDYEELPF